MLFLQEVQQPAVPESTKFVFALVLVVVTNFITFWFSRRNTQSQTDKNIADTHKSEADTFKSQIETIRFLTQELDELVISAKGLRKEIGTLEGLNKDLKDTVDLVTQECDEKQEALEELFQEERVVLLKAVKNIAGELSDLIDMLANLGFSRSLRAQLIKILENLRDVQKNLIK